MSANFSTAQWFLLSPSGSQEGPFKGFEMLQKISDKILYPSTLVWTAALREWKKAEEVDTFQRYFSNTTEMAVSAENFMYINEAGTIIGPLPTKDLLERFEKNEIDGMTLVWTTGMAEWKPMGHIQSLKQIITDELDGTGTKNTGKNKNLMESDTKIDCSMMVFEPEEQPVLDKDSIEALAKGRERDEGAKRFIDDSGMKFVWSSEHQSWVEADSEDEAAFEDQSDEESEYWRLKLQKKKSGNVKNQADSAIAEAKDEDAMQDTESDGKGKLKKKKNRKKKKANWSKEGSGRWVYITGLPPDTTDEELKSHFSKVGVIATDPLTQAPRVKLYRDEYGNAKGDASVCYVMEESVDLATHILDESQLRAGVTIKVSKAVFELKGDKIDSTKRLRITDARVRVAKAAEKQALSWNESDDCGLTKKGLKIVVIENMFEPDDFRVDPHFGEDLEADLVLECQKLGPLEKITVFSKNPIGPVVIKFGTAFAAEECIKKMDGRWFGQRRLRCHFWDGMTNYDVKEDESKEEERLKEFGDWLDTQELPQDMQVRME